MLTHHRRYANVDIKSEVVRQRRDEVWTGNDSRSSLDGCVLLTAAAAAGPPGYPISAGRAAALQECSPLGDDWSYAYRACMAQHGQAE